MPFKSLINSSNYLPCRRVSSRDDHDAPTPFVFVAAKRRRVVTLARTNVGITTRGGFIIPANDLTKRTRRPGMDRVESQFPVLSSSRPIIVSFSFSLSLSPSLFPGREVILPSIFSAVQSMLAPSCGPRIYIPHKPLEMSLDGRHRGYRDLQCQWYTTCAFEKWNNLMQWKKSLQR